MNDKEIKLIAVLELLRTDKSLTEIANKYKILPTTLEKWKDSFLSNAHMFFKEDKYKSHYKEVHSTREILLNTNTRPTLKLRNVLASESK